MAEPDRCAHNVQPQRCAEAFAQQYAAFMLELLSRFP